MLEEIERRIKQRLDLKMNWLAAGSAASFESYKEASGEVSAYRYSLDIIRDVMREHEKL